MIVRLAVFSGETWELTAQTKPRPTMKGYVTPTNIRKRRSLPPLRSKVVCVIAVQVFPSVQVVRHKTYTNTASNEQWSVAVRSSAARQPSGFLGYTDIYGDGGVKSESYIERSVEARQWDTGKQGESLRTLVQYAPKIGHLLDMGPG